MAASDKSTLGEVEQNSDDTGNVDNGIVIKSILSTKVVLGVRWLSGSDLGSLHRVKAVLRPPSFNIMTCGGY
jgi:hypothetical protein